jgi:23S rRNA pseudouridine1911/1915/1917 synthase
VSDASTADRRCLRVEEEGEGARIDVYLAERVEAVSRTQIQRLIRAGEVLLDGRPCKPSTSVAEGQEVTWPVDAGLTEIRAAAEPVPIDAVFEDDDLLVLHKPPGLVIHPGPGNWNGTLVNGLLDRWPDWVAPGGGVRPGIVHRLDKDTSGLLVVARSARAYQSLREQFSAHTTERLYVALVWGHMPQEEGEIDRPIGRDPRNRQHMAVVDRGGKPARTHWQVLATFDSFALLRLGLHTGRTHQVRVHLASVGHPVVGDPLYGGITFATRLAPADRTRARGLMGRMGRVALHAYHLGLRHPADGEWLVFEAPVPRDMEGALLELMEPGGNE